MKKYIFIGLIALLVTFLFFANRRPVCRLYETRGLTLATVKIGAFSEWIPQTGIVQRDSNVVGGTKVMVPIDELYLSRISKGLKATSSLNNKELELLVTEVFTTVNKGRFEVAMRISGEAPKISIGQQLRLRLQLSEPSNELLLPVGDFFGDTGGKWVFVIEDNRAVKRKITLGRKNSDYYEVKEGLKPGEQVITSSYELFVRRDSLDMVEIANLY